MAGTRPITPAEEVSVRAAQARFPLRDQALMAMLGNTGFRISEVLSLRLGEVWDGAGIRSRVSLPRFRLKGGRGAYRRSVAGRSVVLNDRVMVALEQYLFQRFGSAGPADLAAPVFPSRKGGAALTRGQGTRLVQRVFAAAGIRSNGAGELGAHSLRKGFCRQIYEASGRDINLTRAAMAHTNVLTTQRYLCVDSAAIDEAVLAIGRAGEVGAHAGDSTGWPVQQEVTG